MSDRQTYDVAVSFSGAQRMLVENYVRACQALGLSVFYDKDVAAQMWGRNFIYEFRKIYGQGNARYVVPFFSREYLGGSYPMDEYGAAVTWSIEQRDDVYILPIVIGDVRVPEDLLNSSTAFLRAEEWTAAELAKITAERVRSSSAGASRPSPAATSSRISSGASVSRLATNSISGVIWPARAASSWVVIRMGNEGSKEAQWYVAKYKGFDEALCRCPTAFVAVVGSRVARSNNCPVCP